MQSAKLVSIEPPMQFSESQILAVYSIFILEWLLVASLFSLNGSPISEQSSLTVGVNLKKTLSTTKPCFGRVCRTIPQRRHLWKVLLQPRLFGQALYPSNATFCRLLYLFLLAAGSFLMAAMLTPDVQHNLQSAFKGLSSLLCIKTGGRGQFKNTVKCLCIPVIWFWLFKTNILAGKKKKSWGFKFVEREN